MLNGKAEHPTAKELTEKLGGEWNAHRRSGKCVCPAHKDNDPSLDITEKGGRTLVICRAGCSQDAVFDELRGRGRWPARNGKADGRAGQPKTIIATYPYRLSDGRESFQVVHFAPKTFRPRRSDGKGGHVWNLPRKDRHLPYRLPEILEAIALEKPVLVVEGEKDVDNLATLGVVATCNAGGAGKWKAAHATYLKGGDVVIIPDNDAAGQKHAESVAASLVGIAKRIRVLTLPDLPPKGDASDWIESGGTAEQLWKLAEQARQWQPPIPEDTETEIDHDLADMNAKFAVARIGGKTRVVFMEESFSYPGCMVPVYSSLPDFRAFHDKRKKTVEVNGEEKQIGLGTWWIRNEQRQQYDGIVYMPNSSATLTAGKLNLWTGYGCVPRGGDCSAFLTHLLDNVCCRVKEHYEYLVNWMAYAVQHPGRQGEVAVVMRGNEGTGKGITAKQFGRLLGSHFRHITQAGHLTGHFNAHLQHCSVLFADEAFFAGDRSHVSILKALITEETLMIEPKGVDPFPVRNCLHLTGC